MALSAGPLHAEAPCYLWSVQGHGQQGYIVGTIHMHGQEAFTSFHPAWRRLINNFEATALLPETSLDRSTVIEVKRRARVDTPLQKRLPPGLFAELKRVVRKYDRSVQKFQDIAVPDLATELSVRLADYEHHKLISLDTIMEKRARASGLSILPLETLNEQIELQRHFSQKHPNAMLRTTLASLNDTAPRKQFQKLWTAYRSCKANKLQALLSRSGDKLPKDAQRTWKAMFLYERNDDFAAAFQQALNKNERPIMAVGVAHLLGKKTVQAHLRSLGYTVRRVRQVKQITGLKN